MKLKTANFWTLILLLLFLSQACQPAESGEVKKSELLKKLPESVARQVDSLMQIEQKFIAGEVPETLLAEIQQQIAFSLVERAPTESLFYFEKVLAYFNSVNRKDMTGNIHKLMARIYHEKLNRPEEALQQLLKSEAIWAEFGDELKRIEVLQYEAVMEAKLGRTEEGMQKINTALDFYEENQFGDEILSTYCDLAHIAHLAGDSETALTYINKAINHYNELKAYAQLITANNLKLRILIENDLLQEAISLFNAQNMLIHQTRPHWTHQLTFLQLGRSLLLKSGNLKEGQDIENRYRSLTDSLDREKLVYF